MVHRPIHPSSAAHFAGSTHLLGVATAMFFKCMGVLLSPTNSIGGIKKWALVAHTVAMFTFLTIPTGIGLNFSSTCYINHREFSGTGEFPPGPIGYSLILKTEAAYTAFNVMFPLNQWLADGFLVGLIPNPVPSAFNIRRSSSYIVVILFILRTSGPWSSHAWCTSLPLVHAQVF